MADTATSVGMRCQKLNMIVVTTQWKHVTQEWGFDRMGMVAILTFGKEKIQVRWFGVFFSSYVWQPAVSNMTEMNNKPGIYLRFCDQQKSLGCAGVVL